MKKTLAGILCVTALLGCVLRTEHKIDAHITLDIRHIQQQAEQTLDYIEGRTDELPGLSGAAPPSMLRQTLAALNPVKVAHARDLRAESPLVREILDSLRERHPRVDAMKKQGCFGENNRGYVDLRECDALGDAERRAEAQQLLADENRDRRALYTEIARLNREDGATLSTVESVYAMQRLNRATTGEQVQLPPAGAAFDELRDSPLGQRLGGALQPGAWVSIP